jgi:hypothetical protein
MLDAEIEANRRAMTDQAPESNENPPEPATTDETSDPMLLPDDDFVIPETPEPATTDETSDPTLLPDDDFVIPETPEPDSNLLEETTAE